jgi:tRNA pseudouridine55 synthase
MLLNIYKSKGLTPLEVVKLIKEKYPEYKNAKIGYAGRLDPLAHGVLLLMVGEETTKQKDKYLNLPKEYEFEAVFGISTDTYDALGIIKNPPVIASEAKQPPGNKIASSSLTPRNDELKEIIQYFIKSQIGKQSQLYPPYSSKTVQGKPLYWWAKNNRLSEIKIPKRGIEIYDFKLLKISKISTKKLREQIMKQINSVSGDFRQKEIKTAWNNFFTNDQRLRTNDQFLTAKLKISCSSGTYIRALVNELGEKIGCEAITLEIIRTKVGDYDLKNSIKLL